MSFYQLRYAHTQTIRTERKIRTVLASIKDRNLHLLDSRKFNITNLFQAELQVINDTLILGSRRVEFDEEIRVGRRQFFDTVERREVEERNQPMDAQYNVLTDVRLTRSRELDQDGVLAGL